MTNTCKNITLPQTSFVGDYNWLPFRNFPNEQKGNIFSHVCLSVNRGERGVPVADAAAG